MWIADLNLGETYAYQGKPVILRQTRIRIPDDDFSCIVFDPVTGEDIPCKPHALSPCTSSNLSCDSKTLQGVRNILTYLNKQTLPRQGSYDPGTAVICLRAHKAGYYLPCTACIVKLTRSGKVTVDLWTDKSQRVTVSKRAILWPHEKK